MKEKILIINDDEDIMEFIQMILVDEGYEVAKAANGPSGLELAAKEHPHLILLDIIMPRMDGYEVCAKLKADAQTKEIPVIFLSSINDTEGKVRALSVGGVDFIPRITDRGEVIARVKTHLRISSLSKEISERNHQLQEKQKNLDEDLAAAAEIQKTLLPSQKIDLTPLKIAWKCLPFAYIGGDVFNVLRCMKDKTIFYLLDVSGHGVPSAMITVAVSQQLQHYATFCQHTPSMPNISSPKEVLEALDRDFPMERFNRFFTIFYVVINHEESTMTYGSAGHPPAALLSPKKTLKLLSTAGTVIGTNENLPFEEKKHPFVPGDKLILYTDGAIEIQNKEGNFFGSERFYKLLESKKNSPVQEMINEVTDRLIQFEEGAQREDDISLLGIEFVNKS